MLDWDDEDIRRAYDRGYWDARREMERHLQRDHARSSGTSSRGSSRGYRDYGSYGRPEESMGYGRSLYGSSSDRSGEWGSSGYEDRSRYDRQEEERDYPPGDRNWAQGRHERGALERAGDEVRSWFGDEEAARRRRADDIRDVHSDRYGYDRVFDRAEYYHEDDRRKR